jgi:hypothetical protein
MHLVKHIYQDAQLIITVMDVLKYLIVKNIIQRHNVLLIKKMNLVYGIK